MRVFKPSDTLSMKNWRLILRNIILPIMVGLGTFLIVDNLIDELHNSSLKTAFAVTGVSIIVSSILFMLMMYLDWLWAIGKGLTTTGNSQHQRILCFCISIIGIVSACAMIICYLALSDSINGNIGIRDLIMNHYLWYFGIVVFLTLLAALCSTITISSFRLLNRPPGSLFVPIYFLILLFPIGYLILQPKINRLNLQIDHDDSPKIDDILDSPLT